MNTATDEIREDLTDEEAGWVALMRINQITEREEIDKSVTIGRYRFRFHWRSRENLWGRFGGGWNWKLGVQVGSTTVMVFLLVFTLSVKRLKEDREVAP